MLTHRHGLVLHVDGGDAGSEEQCGPAGYPDSVKVSVILEGKGVGQKKQLSLPPDPQLPIPQGAIPPRSILKQNPRRSDSQTSPHTNAQHSFICAPDPVLDAEDNRDNEGHSLSQVCGLNLAYHLLFFLIY